MMKHQKRSASCSSLSQLTDRNSSDTRTRNNTLFPVCEMSPTQRHELMLEATALHLDNDEPLYLPKQHAHSSSTCSLDEYLLSSIPRVASRSKELLEESLSCSPSSGKMAIHDNNDKELKCLNVLQGEIAHASATQFDVLVSSDATTCHIVALRSTSASTTTTSQLGVREASPLSSLAHVDNVGYDACLEAMVKEHIRYHNYHTVSNDVDVDEYGFFLDEDEPMMMDGTDNRSRTITSTGNNRIEMEIHMLGGFLDKKGESQKLSTSLLMAFRTLAEKYRDAIKMKISTAVISCMNSYDSSCMDSCDATTQSPLGRGLGIDTRSGRVFVANSVPSHLQGPGIKLRSARAFRTTTRENELLLKVIHCAWSDRIRIDPFAYEHIKEMDLLANLPDKNLLSLISTSPECESNDFCQNVRSTIGFIKRVPSNEVFGRNCNTPLVYRRKSTNSLNEWILQ